VAVRNTSPYDGRVKNVTERGPRKAALLEVFQKQKIPAQKGMFLNNAAAKGAAHDQDPTGLPTD
jgi:hypothetical protein